MRNEYFEYIRFEFTEQAINAIYVCADKPDSICGDMIKAFTSKVFNLGIVNSSTISQGIIQINEVVQEDSGDGIKNEEINSDRVVQLSKLCFMVGHVAVKEIVHLEAIESEWKRRKYLGILLMVISREKRI